MDKILSVSRSFFERYRNKIAFFMLCVSIFSFAFVALKNFDNLKVPYFNGIYDDVVINIETPDLDGIPIKLYLGNDKTFNFISRFRTKNPLAITNYYSNTIDYKKYKKLSIIYPADFTFDLRNYIATSNVFIGNRHFYFGHKDIKFFEQKIIEVNGKKVKQLILPAEIRKFQNAEYMNYKGNYNAVAVVFLSFFYSAFTLYLIPWILFIVGIWILKNERLKIPTSIILSAITLLAIYLRFNLFTEYPMWWDECYTATITGDIINPFSDIFFDPGNPPFFALVSRLWQSFVPNTIEWLRTLPLIFSVGSILTLYLLIKTRINTKTALLASFLLTVSIFHINYAQDYRAFSLSSMLTPLVVYFMFKMLEKMNFLNTFLFVLFSSMIFSNHLYGTILLIVNFIYGIWYILTKYQEKLKSVLTFLCAHLLVGMTFLPYFFNTFLQKAVLNSNFNVWLPDMCWWVFLNALRAMFGNWQIALSILILSIIFIVCMFCFKNKLFTQVDTKQREFIFYLIYLVFGFLLVNITISSIRAIIMEYYFMLIYPMSIALISTLFMLNWRYKFINVILSFGLLYTVSHMDYNNLWKFKNVYGSLTQVSNADAINYKKNKVLVYEQIEPPKYGELFELEPNVVVETDFNGGSEDFTKFTKKVRKYAKDNPTQFAIFNAWYSEVTSRDQAIFEDGNFEYIAEFIKTPYDINDGILRVVLLPQK